ncbi:phosphoadenosine phosphosulfate reductase [Schizosaccharomyces japonicus yFS275]|uniref:Phosphoadenosine phosphosulfate reductase n=1 Tax=Schizosaccharomyces japonicus (strain yFS275 / FY16936) TaxID=402676 RepID=B6K5T4_SCHJY|nr:phosphoadenosine phosphosulfate reductase [Schizosaccharomyces japonicus yFS275]EEB08888.1 phosphoadenosine phosphosulfate reductase [Schizosaccharomyces japonicus yFS275]
MSSYSDLKADQLFQKEHLAFLNEQLSHLEPPEVLRWCLVTFPRLFQTSALGLSGLVITDMLAKMDHSVPLIFINTLYHFPETLDLLERVRQTYPKLTVNVFKADGVKDTKEFEEKFGKELWERDEMQYDYLVKVEPSRRAYKELGVLAVFTGRRRSQGGERGDLDILQIDGPVLKINPLANWSFEQVMGYIREHNVPYNALLDRGYRSVGDWHSTQPVKEGEDERAGRWKGKVKTECGLHSRPDSKFAQYVAALQKKKAEEAAAKAAAAQ